MSQQLKFQANQYNNYDGTPSYESRKCDQELIHLLQAPKAEFDAMSKAQAFDFSHDRLQSQLGKGAITDMVMGIFSEHFPLSTMTAEQET